MLLVLDLPRWISTYLIANAAASYNYAVPRASGNFVMWTAILGPSVYALLALLIAIVHYIVWKKRLASTLQIP